MKSNEKKILKHKNLFKIYSNFWLWPIFAGVFFGIGYSITKNIYLAKVQSSTTSNRIQEGNESSNPTKTFSIGNNQYHPEKDKTLKKIIYLPSYKDPNLRLEIKYSQNQNLKNQAVFKNNHYFFAKETLKSLMKTLKNAKKTKSYKVLLD